MINRCCAIGMYLICGYIALAILTKEYLNNKPSYRILGKILFCEAVLIQDKFTQAMQRHIVESAYSQVQKIYPDDKYTVLYTILFSQNNVSFYSRAYGLILVAGLQIAVFLDLFYLLRDPFSPRERRIKFFYFIPIGMISYFHFMANGILDD